MSCDDLDRLRVESAHSGSSSWPREVRRHLESCERYAVAGLAGRPVASGFS